MEKDLPKEGKEFVLINKPAVPVYYVGHLSRFQLLNEPVKDNHLLILLSGPEPQRSILENKIIREIAHYPSTATIGRGLPGSDLHIPSTGMLKFYNHLTSYELNKEIEQADYIISRSGYSTIMDLVKLKKKSILIPTPGQTEQEYLADYLTEKKIAFCVSQKEFSITAALENAAKFSYHFPSFNPEQPLSQLISKLIATAKKSKFLIPINTSLLFFGIIEKQKFFFCISKISPVITINLYCKNATGRNVVNLCICELVGKICNTGIVRE